LPPTAHRKVIRAIQRRFERSDPWAWIGVGLALLFGSACVPPSIDDLSGPPTPSIVETVLSNITPAGEEVSLIRKQGSFLVFDVRNGFSYLAEEGQELFYYWYVDWDTDNQVIPLTAGEDSLQYFACGNEFDPPEINGTYPAQRTIMVIAATQALADESQAYLSQDEGLSLSMYDWTIVFEGPYQCIGDGG
jgi:hypothetical protein